MTKKANLEFLDKLSCGGTLLEEQRDMTKKVDSLLAYLKWWDEKNEDKENNLEYDIDFETEVVQHISQGETIQTMEVTDDS